MAPIPSSEEMTQATRRTRGDFVAVVNLHAHAQSELIRVWRGRARKDLNCSGSNDEFNMFKYATKTKLTVDLKANFTRNARKVRTLSEIIYP